MIAADGTDLMIRCEFFKNLKWITGINPEGASILNQFRLNSRKSPVNEKNAGILPVFQLIQNVPVKNVDRLNIAFIFQRMVQTCIILQPEVSPEPENGISFHWTKIFINILHLSLIFDSKIMKRDFLYFVFVILLVAFIPSCQDDADSPEIRIGVLLSLTGTGSSTGESSLAAMNLAKEDILNYLQSIEREMNIEFILEDSQTDPGVALEKLKSLRSKGCLAVVGPYSSAEVSAVKDYCDENGVIVISPSSVAVSLAIDDDNVYRMAPDDRNQAEAIVELLKDDQKKNLVAVIRDDLWGNELTSATYKQFLSAGGSLNTIISYSPNTTDFSTVIHVLSDALGASLETHSAQESGIYMVTFKEGTEIMRLASQEYILQQVDWYGASAYAENSTLPLDWTAAAFAMNHHLACPIFGYDETSSDKWQPLVDRIKVILDREPEIYALNVYDALWLTVLTYLSLEDPFDLAKFKTAFEFQCSNFSGITGRTTLNAAGDRLFATYDFWSMRLFLNDFSWYRSAAYNNATGELKRY